MIFLRKLKILILISSILIILFSFLIITINAAPLVWEIETIASPTSVEGISIALDSNDIPHICYNTFSAAYGLNYARLVGSTWDIQNIGSGNAGIDCSLALDSSDFPHISYLDLDGYDLKYARWTGEKWDIETVDSAGLVGKYTSLALDYNNYPHISYYDQTNHNLKYARWTGQKWDIQTVDSGKEAGLHSSLVLDYSNRPHIAYESNVDGDLMYAKWTGSEWQIQTIDSSGSQPCIALWLGQPYVSYYSEQDHNLKVARRGELYWYLEVVDASRDVGERSSIVVDSRNDIHIIYYDRYHENLKYAFFDNSWSINVIYSFGSVGYVSSLAVDSSNNPHVSYWDATSRELKYGKDPDETIIHTPAGFLDVDDDGFDSGIEVWINADTTYAGSVNVSAIGSIFRLGNTFYQNISNWEINGAEVEYQIITLYLPEYRSPGAYDVMIQLSDERNALEDWCFVLEDHYFYPPGYGCVESFSSVTSVLFDSNGDGDNDVVEISMDVDTTYSGSLDVFANATLVDSEGNIYYNNSTSWTITSTEEEWAKLRVYAPVGTSEGDYRVEIRLFDEWGNQEEFYRTDVLHLSPPQQSGRLEGRVTDIDTGEPIEDVWVIAVGDVYQTSTGPSGYYGFPLPAGEYLVYTEDYEHETQETLVRINSGSTTVQDFALRRSHWALLIQVEGSGTTNPAGAFSNLIGSEMDVTAIPDAGWAFSHWNLDGENVGSANPITIIFDSHHTLTAVFEEVEDLGRLEGTVTESGTGLPVQGVTVNIVSETLGYSVSAYTDELGYYEYDLPVGDFNVTASHQHFQAQTALVNIPSDTEVTQNFILNRNTWELDLGINGLGTIDPAPGSYLYQIDETIQVLAAPQEGWILDYWIYDSVYHEPTNPFSVTINDHHALFAVFSETITLMRTIEIETLGSGTTEPGLGIYHFPDGSEIIIQALPQEGWRLSHWMLEDINIGSDNPISITINENQGLTAIFVEIPPPDYYLTVNVVGSGSTSIPLGTNGPYFDGDYVTVVAQPDSGWELDFWVLDFENVGDTTSYTLSMNEHHGLTAVFKESTPGENQRPNAILSVESTTVNIDEGVVFSGSDSNDPDGQIVLYYFDFGDGTNSGWISSSTISHNYSSPGTYVVTIQVQDNEGLVSSSESTLSVTLTVIPEFPSWIIAPLFLTIGIFSMLIKKRIPKRN